ncbi:MAG: SUMF1/EgtB/PvdO family nonheme iron enzyme [Gemmatimonadota bacterium]
MKLPRIRLVLTLAVVFVGRAAPANAQQRVGIPVRLQPYTDTIPGALLSFTMLPIPAGSIEMPSAHGPVTVAVPAFWIAKTEVTWDVYDIFAFRLDVPREDRPKVDANARPSRPYGAPDRGYGHAGYPAIGMTGTAAEAFAAWLSAKTGHSYRIPTEAEWARAAAAAFGDRPLSRQRVEAVAWSADNAGGQTHPVGQKLDDQVGVHDLLGNVAEWVTTADSGFAVRGGSFRDPAGRLTIALSVRQDSTWNQTDPQIPKSRWWLSDAPFTGIRLVRVP